MKKRLLSSLLLGALFVTSTSVFVSCKDYDDDINGLQDQLNQNAAVIDALQKSFDAGVVITSVQKQGSKLIITTSDKKTWEISDGTDGKDAVVWEIGPDGYWYKDNVATEYKAVGANGKDGVDGKDGKDGKDGVDGKDGKDGVNGKDGQDGSNGVDGKYYVPNAQTGCFDIYQNGKFVEMTNISWAQDCGITSAMSRKNVVMKGVSGVDGDIIIPTAADLAMLVFIPDRYYWGIEATTIKTLKTPWWDLSKQPLNSWIDEKDRLEAVGQWATDNVEARIADYNYVRNFTVPRVNPGGVDELMKHGRYSITGKTPATEYYVYHNGRNDSIEIRLTAAARYHINPTVADMEETTLEVLDQDRLYTRAEHSAAVVTLQGADGGENKMWSVDKENGILTVPLHIAHNDKLGTVKSLTARNAADGVTTFATQATFMNAFNEQTKVTSDYACIYEEKVTNLILAHVKYHPTETDTYDDWIQTGMENRHCGDCSLPTVKFDDNTEQPAYSHHGMHLFASVEEAREYVTNTPRKNVTTGALFDLNYTGEGQDLVPYHENICLNDLVETHFTNESGQHDYFPTKLLNQYFYYRFYLTSFIIGTNQTDESAHACILTDENGKSYLHPLDPKDNGARIGKDPQEINNDLNNWTKTTEVVVNRVPLVRVELVSREENKVVDFGYIPIRIVKEIVEKPATYVTFDGYQMDKWEVNSIAKCIYDVKGADLTTNWRNTEEDLFMLANQQLGEEYPVLDRITFDAHYSPELYTGSQSMVQYLAKDGKVVLDANGKPKEVAAAPLDQAKIGDIYYDEDNLPDGTHTSVFHWTNITLADILALSNNTTVKANGLQRAVKLVSDDPVNYPTIFVIFKSQAIAVSNVDVTLDAHLKEHIIPEYLYKKNAYNELGSDEIHANTLTPEDNDLTDRTSVTYYYDMNRTYLHDDLGLDRNKESGNSTWVDPTEANSQQKNAWKPAYLDDNLSDVFVGNLMRSTPADWITLSPNNAQLLAKIRNNDLDLDFVFDASNVGKQYKGKTDEGIRTFKLSLSANKKILFAEDINHLAWGKDTIAEIVIDGADDLYDNKWNKVNTRLQMMRVDYKRQTRLGYAEAMLNYKGSHELDDETILATVALVAYAKIDYTNNLLASTVNYYCELPMINYTFDVRFLRPISIDKSKQKVIEDAYSTGSDQSGKSAQVIKLNDLRPSYKDWRELTWKTGIKLAANTNDYEQYYAQNDTTEIGFTIDALSHGQKLSKNEKVKTTLGLANMNAPESQWKKLADVSDQLDFTYYDTYTDPITGTNYNEPVIVYRNLSSTVGDFKVSIPVVIEYYWGKYYDNIVITIKRTAGARRN